MSDPNLLDLDALEETVRAVVIKGVSHEFQAITVENWLANLHDVRALGAFMDRDDVTPDQVAKEQMSVTIKSLLRSYPTFTEPMLRKMSMAKLDAIIRFTRALDGSDKVEKELEAEAAVNPPLPSPTEPTTA